MYIIYQFYNKIDITYFIITYSITRDRMTLQQVISGLETLQEYPELTEYIKSFNGNAGFMFTVETEPDRIRLSKQMEKVLDSDGMHSGGSWGYMLRTIQRVLIGNITKEQVMEQAEIEKRNIQEWREAMRKKDEEWEAKHGEAKHGEAKHMEAKHGEAKHVEASQNHPESPPPYSK
jgi:hypothetical protein